MPRSGPLSPPTIPRRQARFRERFEPLLSHPELVPARDDLAPGLRVPFFRDYAFYYRYTDTEIIIVRVLHGARDARALLGSDE
ncbi:MAG: type II toxin-antitoxin system RelE/ParE family toxin [Pseudomonadota bacterium]|nr:type II toxin-antitoxin system RelE/ParE family toxin [Pseudomonadota bacterium]